MVLFDIIVTFDCDHWLSGTRNQTRYGWNESGNFTSVCLPSVKLSSELSGTELIPKYIQGVENHLRKERKKLETLKYIPIS